MNRFARYVLRLHLVPFLVGFGVITVIFALDFLFEYVDLIVAKGVPPLVVGRLFLLGQGWMIALSVPCSVLVAVLVTFGKLSQDREISAMRASGVPMITVLLPLVGASGLLAVGLTLFNNHILPETNHQFANLMYDIGQKRPAFKLEEGVFINDFEGYRLFVGRVNGRTGEMQDVTIFQLHPDGRMPSTVTARRGRLTYNAGEDAATFNLEDGEIHEVPTDADRKDRYRRLFFKRHSIRIAGLGEALRTTERNTRSDREMSTRDMQVALQGLERERTSLIQHTGPILARYGLRNLYQVDALTEEPPGAPSPGIGAALAFLSQLVHRRGAANDSTATSISGPDLSTLQLYLLQLRALDDQRQGYGVEIQKKFAIPAACVVFVLIGAPLGLRVRRTGPSVAFASLLFFLFYYICLVGGEEMAKHNTLSPFLAMWLPNLLLGAVGVYLTLQEAEVLPR